MYTILVSACLMGQPVRYDGRAKPTDHEIVARWRAQGRLVSFCPEVAGGLPIPRPPAEIEPAADSAAVLGGEARILTPENEDVTDYFLAGARAALAAARHHDARIAVLKESSPSCGVRRVYDGSFTGRTRPGEGVTARLLREHGLAVFNEHEIAQAQTALQALESGHAAPD
ncbi:2-thiouracil desulfurase family protein [Salinactinospora qingdaonensis]|uniref:DUF523 domain-containing protein n=1 Tax=Salinactinospora qingdaonensis TaxID=702744 RepID=A0ABP7FPB0_9ACTN